MGIKERPPSVLLIAWVGMLGLASGMGIGRFGFTPVLPLMQGEGLTLADGSALAAANYLGYLLGALACVALNPLPGAAARAGLLAVAVLTLAMGSVEALAWWWWLRFAAGVASAFVLVGVSSWAMAHLARLARSSASGWVFAGVGVGISTAGLIGLVAGLWGWDAGHAWWALGTGAFLALLLTWPALGSSAPAASAAGPGGRLDARAWRLVACYGAFGYGYIIPATFLPALARQWFDDPGQFGWVWPVFGVAAALSTLLASPWLRGGDARRPWALAMVVMAVGVAAPVLSSHPLALLAAAVCVGGTFMVATMAGLQEARRMGGASATRLIAAMTAAFAAGQWLGPVSVSLMTSRQDALTAPSVVATIVLLLAAAVLWPRAAPALPSLDERTTR